MIATSPDGCAVSYEVHGAGPAVVFPLGLAFSRLAPFYADYARLLQDDFTVVFADVRGAGDSDSRPAEECTAAAVTGDLVAVLDDAGISRAAAWGYSFTAALSIQLALRHPDRVSALVVGGFPPLGADYSSMRDHTADLLRDSTPQDPLHSTHHLYAGLFASLGGRSADPDVAGLTLPRLAFWGSEDDFVVGGHHCAWAQVNRDRRAELDASGWSTHELPGLTHEGLMARPDLSVPLVRTWLAAHA